MPETRYPRAASAIAAQLPTGFTTRFAPAPTGHLHLGHLVNAIWVWGLAHARGGRVLLRIEDHDRGRSRPEYERSILDDLAWLGLEANATDPAGAAEDSHAAFTRQSDRLALYAASLAALETRGLAYTCRCSRAEIQRENDSNASELRYPGTCRDAAVPRDESLARRILMEPGAVSVHDLRCGELFQDPASQCGDLLARDRHGNFTYQFAVVVDDLDQRVNVVIRGEDLLPSCARQQQLGALLGRSTPPIWVHHPLLRHPDGRKLSKSAGDTGVRELRAAGRSSAEVLGLAALASGLTTEHRTLDARALAELFV